MTTTLQHKTHQVSRKQKYTYTISCPRTTVVKQGLTEETSTSENLLVKKWISKRSKGANNTMSEC